VGGFSQWLPGDPKFPDGFHHHPAKVRITVEDGFSSFLLDLYRLTGSAPSVGFVGAVFDVLANTLPFDAGLWATFTATPAGPIPHWHQLHGLPEQMLEEYERVKQYDVLNQEAVAHCGRTLNVSLAGARGTAHPAIFAHARRWGMEQTLATMWLESPLNLFTAICLYRKNRSRPFSEDERRFKEAVIPHLVQAWHLNAIHFFDATRGPARGVPRARALIDRFGVLHNAESGLTALLRREVPNWEGPNIPQPLLAVLDNEETVFKGQALVASLLRRLPDRTFVISVRPRALIDSLTRRELAVAREFASGKTYKEIARLHGISPTTVRTQIQMVYDKLKVRSKVGLLKHVEEFV
jgi:DNA-binding CsgD family transcriptional regulator